MKVTKAGVLPPSSKLKKSVAIMRSETYVQPRAVRLRDERGSATAKYGRVVTVVHDWVEAGGIFLTPLGTSIDMELKCSGQDPHVYPEDGGPIFRELPKFRLLEPASAFHEDPKRTMLRVLAKADGMDTALDRRLLSAVFWVAAYLAITGHQAG